MKKFLSGTDLEANIFEGDNVGHAAIDVPIIGSGEPGKNLAWATREMEGQEQMTPRRLFATRLLNIVVVSVS